MTYRIASMVCDLRLLFSSCCRSWVLKLSRSTVPWLLWVYHYDIHSQLLSMGSISAVDIHLMRREIGTVLQDTLVACLCSGGTH